MSDEFGEQIRAMAQDLVYPPMKSKKTVLPFPYQGQLLRRVALVTVVLALAGLAVPDIRAKMLDLFQIGAATITLDSHGVSGGSLRLDDVYGETDIETAQANVSYELLYPEDDLPDRVYLQDDELVIFVWIERNDISQVLYQVPDSDWGIFKTANAVTQTEVNEETALWLDIQHPVQFINGTTELTYFVTGNVLIWIDGNITYRLETEQAMASAQTFAESLLSLSD